MKNRWRIVVELTFDIDPEDEKERYPGDADVDFANRALERVRPDLNRVLDGAFAHYHILETPTKVGD